MTPPRKPSVASALRQAAAPVEPAAPSKGDFAIHEDDQWRERQRRPSKPARITLNLPPGQNREFQQWILDTAREFGWNSLSQQDTLRAMIRTVLSEPEVAARVRNSLWCEYAYGGD